MIKNVNKKKFASNLAISFFFAAIFVLCYYFLLEDKIMPYVSLINTTAVRGEDIEIIAKYNIEAKRLIDYPSYGSKYATLEIPSINLNLPVYHGDNKKILRLGVGHYTGSYFPGENGSILYAAHNNAGLFHDLDKIKVGDIITIKATYGTFKYQMKEYKIVKETDLSAFPIQHDKELLMMYTCWPIDKGIAGHKKDRYVVYAEKIGDEIEKE